MPSRHVVGMVARVWVFILLVTTMLAPWLGASAQTEPPQRLGTGLELTSEQQASLALDAVRGSPEAARKLATYHFIVRGDRDLALKWYTVGAENGDAACAFGLYNLLNGSVEEQQRLRAMFWLKKAADDGLGYAKDELKALGK